MFQNIKTIFFDFDGTLHDSSKIYVPAFKKAYQFLIDNNGAEEKEWTDEEVASWLGYTSIEMWKKFMPNLDENIRKEASKIIGKEMNSLLATGSGYLYDGTIHTLEYLKGKGYSLVFLSNCGNTYKETVRKVFYLDKYFSNFLCAEEYDYIPKFQIFKEVRDQYKEEMVIIGDRIHDIETGVKNNIHSIGCLYGYGNESELTNASYCIQSITELINIL
ncbi:phosphoglycolate phosphatase [Natranaerovirga pectinivora]|uniref:Phosphoglycolate phosphatase n=1 Tax=Natranaerovirga pectinivora TaxID=682400 RepID=A0A4R3MRC1_9FIRM|nr:HAD family hydrolase [Natranaerovirga pectinivora]TCT15711.1 phosphoglycolate phosphatase [Natranaerovirga pectinivora]